MKTRTMYNLIKSAKATPARTTAEHSSRSPGAPCLDVLDMGEQAPRRKLGLSRADTAQRPASPVPKELLTVFTLTVFTVSLLPWL
jgi:hypothetical protein